MCVRVCVYECITYPFYRLLTYDVNGWKTICSMDLFRINLILILILKIAHLWLILDFDCFHSKVAKSVESRNRSRNRSNYTGYESNSAQNNRLWPTPTRDHIHIEVLHRTKPAGEAAPSGYPGDHRDIIRWTTCSGNGRRRTPLCVNRRQRQTLP